MAYIGNAPLSGAFKKLDSLTFNGVTTIFAATVASTAVILGTAQNVLISISGVLQEPGSAYTVSGSNINFSEAPLATDTFFGVLLGSVGEVNTVTDGAITAAKLAPGAITLIGPTNAANFTRFPNAQQIIANTAPGIQQNEAHNIGVIGEATANSTDTNIWGAGLYGVGYTAGGTRAGGVVGESHVSATSDTGSAIGVRGYAKDAHTGGMNIGLLGEATGGLTNYALYMNGGNITSTAAQTWALNGDLTFSGAYAVTLPTINATTIVGTDGVASRLMLKDIGSVYLDKGTVGTGTVTFDYSSGACQRLQVSGALTVALSNFPPSGNLGVMQLELVNGGSATVTMPAINWVKLDGTFTTSISTYLTNVSRNTLQTTGTDFIMIWSRDAGTTVYGKIL